MVFRRISIRLALQFTIFVTLLLFLNGVAFIAADFRVARNAIDEELLQDTYGIAERLPLSLKDTVYILTPRERERMRIMDQHDKPLIVGSVFLSIPYDPAVTGFRNAMVHGEEVRYITAPIIKAGQKIGTLQIARNAEVHLSDLPRRVLTLGLIVGAISVLTFLVGLYFAKRSLKPAEVAMERLEQFTQDASHELRTPLAILGSSLDVAMKTGKYKEGIISAKDDLKRIASLVEKLLELARIDGAPLPFTEVSVSDLVERVVNDYAAHAEEKEIVIHREIKKNVTVRGDTTLLMQVVGNLLSNAIKFTDGGGRIDIRLTEKTLAVTDTGIGIPTKDLPAIFDRFYQADASRSNEGFGLGLSLSKRILDLHGFSIDVKSTQGKGTTFMVGFGKK